MRLLMGHYNLFFVILVVLAVNGKFMFFNKNC